MTKREPPYPQKPLSIGRARVRVLFRFTYPAADGSGLTTDADWVAVVDHAGPYGQPHEIQMELAAVRRARDWFARAADCIAYRNAQRRRERRARERKAAR